MNMNLGIGAILGLACFLCSKRVAVDFDAFAVLKRLNGNPIKDDVTEPVICNNCLDKLISQQRETELMPDIS